MTHNTDITPTKVHRDAKLGVIPDGWNLKTLDEIGSFTKGKGISKSEILESSDSGFSCVRYAEIYTKYHNYAYTFESRINEESANNSNEIKFGDILFAGSGETLGDIGKAIAYLGNDKAYAGGDIIIFRQENEDSRYLGFLMNNDFVRSQLHKLGQGHSVVHIYGKSLKKVKIPIPPLSEQQKIAKILATWDVAINNQEALIAQKQEQKKALMQQLLTGKKRFAGFGDEWEEVRLGEISKSFSGGTPSSKNYDYYNGNIHWIKSGELNQVIITDTEDFITELGLKNSSAKIVQPKTLLVAMYGATAGVCAITEIKGAINQAVLAIIPSEKIDNTFLFQKLRMIMPSVVHAMTQGGQPNLSGGIIKKVKIKIPEFIEQQKIAEVLTAADNEITALQQQLQQLKTQKQGLMQNLLTGKIRIKN
ncbi:restriction endonuclease subunit S [Pontimicrobium sp. MEBiC06410]